MFLRRRPFRRNSSASGYTLTEVLVGVAVFSSMLMLGSMALNQSLIQYRSVMERGFLFWEYAKLFWIQKSFSSATDYYVYERSIGYFPYFKGSASGFSYVSLSPFALDEPVAVWVEKERKENGKFALVYYELPVKAKSYRDIEMDYFSGTYRKGKSFRVIEDADSIDFRFYALDLSKGVYEWLREYDGKRRRLLPSLVVVDYLSGGERRKLFLTIETNSMLKLLYNEMYGEK